LPIDTNSEKISDRKIGKNIFFCRKFEFSWFSQLSSVAGDTRSISFDFESLLRGYFPFSSVFQFSIEEQETFDHCNALPKNSVLVKTVHRKLQHRKWD
jgi:hypothetical protein